MGEVGGEDAVSIGNESMGGTSGTCIEFSVSEVLETTMVHVVREIGGECELCLSRVGEWWEVR